MLHKIGKTSPRCPKRLLGDEYTGDSTYWCTVLYLEQVSEQVYKKTFWRQKDQVVKTTQCINHRGVTTT
jgi:hypothetical protein